MTDAPAENTRPATLGEILELVGDIEAAKAEAILETGATPGEIEQALAWAADESDVMGALRRPLDGTVAEVYAILATELPEDDRD